MAIDATSPSVVSATYDKWAITSLTINGDGLAAYGQSGVSPIVSRAVLVKYRVRDDGVSERSPMPGDIIAVDIADLDALALTTTDAGVKTAAALAAMEASIEAVAAEQGKL